MIRDRQQMRQHSHKSLKTKMPAGSWHSTTELLPLIDRLLQAGDA
jgi:hypothetical protein